MKPQNVLLKKNGNKWEAKLTDFGIGRTNEIEGTPGFAPTDLNSYQNFICDDYSVGVTLAFLFFDFKSFWAAMFRPILNQAQITKIENGNNEFHKEALEIIDHLLEGKTIEVKLTSNCLIFIRHKF